MYLVGSFDRRLKGFVASFDLLPLLVGWGGLSGGKGSLENV